MRIPRPRAGGRPGLSLIETIVLVLLLVIGVAFYSVPMRSNRCRGVSTRLVCASNLKGVGTSCKIYANGNGEQWPTPAFDETKIGEIDYRVRVGAGEGTSRSPDRSQPSVGGENGARRLSATRSFWMLVRSGDVTVSQLNCPQGRHESDPTENLELYYDFTDSRNISYGYQVPFGPKETRAREACDNRMILAADLGPYVDSSIVPPPVSLLGLGPGSMPVDAEGRKAWVPYNSPNHRGEGQNVLFADGHVTFERTPIVGVDGDNIYTVALDNEKREWFMIGESPWKRSAPPFAPRWAAGVPTSSTDSVIFP